MNARCNVLALITLLALHVQSALSWGNLGHQTIGFIAQEFLAPNALSFVQTTLGSQYNFSLGPAATWADMVKSEPEFTWSKNLHFVDAEDNPPSSCSVEEIRDCADQICVLAAIANYTTRVVDPTLDAEQIQEALKFIDHFIGDIGQPLHVEAVAAGGNDIDATCSGTKTNLHAAWDTGMLTKNVDAVHGGTSEQYAADLIAEIQTGAFSSLTTEWLSCTSTTEPVNNKRDGIDAPSIAKDVLALFAARDTTTVTPLECPLVWARESNAFDCSTVFNFEPEEDPELCDGTYFTNAIPVIDLQLAKQGFRLAAWLNVIFDGTPALP